MEAVNMSAAADWSGLPMAALDVPSLVRSGAVCTSWSDAYNTFRLPALKQAPCLLYACDEYGPNYAALYCPSTNATFRVPYPGPPHEKRSFVFSCHGWVFATDEVGDPYLLNPITGVQAALPPVKTIMVRGENFYDHEGKHVLDLESEDENGDPKTGIFWAREAEYARVAISPAAEVTACTVLIMHMTRFTLLFARPGDKRWTSLPDFETCIKDVLYNDMDGLFYVLHNKGSIHALDLNGSSPSVTKITRNVTRASVANMYLAVMPSGQLLQVWRMQNNIDVPLKNHASYKDVVRVALQDCIDLANKNDSDKLSETVTDDEQQIDVEEEELRDNEVNTTEVLVFKVDANRQKLVELRDIGEYTIFLGFNAAVCLSTKDTTLEANCIYLTDDVDSPSYHPMLRRDLGIWNIKKRSMQKLGDAWPIMHSWLDLPAPIWITPSLAWTACLAPPIAGSAATTAPHARRRSGRRRVRQRR
ncbi:hypothetical protein CFC21_018607 [Triticum aestivum]|uniref:KIB1-4 beta-propeller domain-containing protein n=3 Tax=Triticum TaxID=4564 RepID=A0A9R1RBW5_TRITD|nr:hypothetical protein CFC21_018607 [Triticum aestivum]VAH35721.1 unnamed protein product [Triticum turgidum subsp. durum]